MPYLYLVQHGESKAKEEDPNRSLTDKGKEDTHHIAKLISQT